MPETARRIVLASRPVGEPKPSDFRLEEFAAPQPGPGEILLRTRALRRKTNDRKRDTRVAEPSGSHRKPPADLSLA